MLIVVLHPWVTLNFEIILIEATVKLVTSCENVWSLTPINSEKNGLMESMVTDQNVNNLHALYLRPQDS